MGKFLKIFLFMLITVGTLISFDAKAQVLNEPNAVWAEENGWTDMEGYYTKTIDHVVYNLQYARNRYDILVNEQPHWFIDTSRSLHASGKIVIPSYIDGFPVKAVGMDTFRNNKNIVECVISEGVEIVGESAFQSCSNLVNVSLPESLKMIDGGAFYMCHSLKEIRIPLSVNYMAKSAFFRNNIQGTGLDKLVFEGDAPLILYTGENAGYSLLYITGVNIYVYEDTFGWDTQAWELQKINFMEPAADAEEIILNVEKLELRQQESFQISATVLPINRRVRWLCEDEEIASVENGVVTGINVGKTMITAYCGNVKAFVEIEVISPEPPIGETTITEVFSDISEGKWYVPYIQAVYEKGLMFGNGNSFNPNQNVTRASFITVLYRFAGMPKVKDYKAYEVFEDFVEGAYYVDAVCWAYNEGLVTGNPDTKKFYPYSEVTRQQMAAVFYRFAAHLGYDISIRGDLCSAINYQKISAYAKDAMSWCLGCNIISGVEIKDPSGVSIYDLAPQENATRAQMAKILNNFFVLEK